MDQAPKNQHELEREQAALRKRAAQMEFADNPSPETFWRQAMAEQDYQRALHACCSDQSVAVVTKAPLSRPARVSTIRARSHVVRSVPFLA